MGRSRAGGVDNLQLVEDLAHLVARSPVEVHRIAMRALAIELNACIAIVFGSFDNFLEAQGRAVVPNAQIRDAVESDLHLATSLMKNPRDLNEALADYTHAVELNLACLAGLRETPTNRLRRMPGVLHLSKMAIQQP